jgi:hypothetical protein
MNIYWKDLHHASDNLFSDKTSDEIQTVAPDASGGEDDSTPDTAQSEPPKTTVDDWEFDCITGATCPPGFADERLQVVMYASLCRVIAGAPVENKLRVFSLMARMAAGDTAAYRQQMMDGLWEVAADDLGLVSLFGVTSVQDVIAAAFAEVAS